MKTIPLLDQYLEERNQLLIDISHLLEKDPNVKAAWLVGSLGREEEDALSDIDLWVVVDDDPIRAIIKHPREYTAQIQTPVLFVEAPQNAPEEGAYLMTCYDGIIAPHIVDWYWQPKSQAYVPSQVRLLFDHAGLKQKDQPIHFSGRPPSKEMIDRPDHFISFFWMMLMITAKYASRFPWAEEIELLPFLIDPIDKARLFIGQDHYYLSDQIPQHRLPSEKVKLLYQLADQMSELMAILSDQGEEIPALIKPGAYRYLDMIKTIVEDMEQENKTTKMN